MCPHFTSVGQEAHTRHTVGPTTQHLRHIQPSPPSPPTLPTQLKTHGGQGTLTLSWWSQGRRTVEPGWGLGGPPSLPPSFLSPPHRPQCPSELRPR